MKNKFSLKLCVTSAVVMLSGISNSHAGSDWFSGGQALSHDPLFLSQTVPPAIVVTMDDSGSMGWAYLGSQRTWCQRLDPNYNSLYYNPNITYLPALRADGTSYPDADPYNAKIDPFGSNDVQSGTQIAIRNLYTDYEPLGQMYRLTNGRLGSVSYWTGHHAGSTTRKAFYKIFNATNNTCTHVQVPDSQMQNFANWFTYYNIREKTAKTAASRAFAQFGNDFKLAWQVLNRNPVRISSFTTLQGTGRTNFFNWLLSVPTSGGTPLRRAFVRAGDKFTEEASYKDINDPSKTLSCQQNFHIAISDGEWNQSVSRRSSNDHTARPKLNGDSTPKYGAYNHTGEQAIYDHASTDSNGRAITDLSDITFHYWQNDLMPSLDNNVKRFKKDYTKADGSTITIPPGQDEWDIPAFVWNPKNNPAYWQHLVNYNVGLGLEANLVQAQLGSRKPCPEVSGLTATEEVYQGLRKDVCNWSNGKYDDVWHSSINSRGDFFSAKNPQELTDALNEVVNNILERLSRGSSSSVSSAVITSDTLAFSPSFDSSNWTGKLAAKQVNEDGSFAGSATWDLSCILTGGVCAETGGNNIAKQTDRKIYTYDRTNNSTVRFSNPLGTAISVLVKGVGFNNMATRLGVTSDQLLPKIVDYVNGDQSAEQSNNGILRNRTSVLSDIVHSSPVVLKGPSETYDDDMWPAGSAEKTAADNGNGYLDYQIAQKDRENVVFVGSNSGMLHAVKASDGEELWGYIPNVALSNIHKLADPKFAHWSFVDNTPVINDAFFDNQWRSVLVGGMRLGGDAFFAIDVTGGANDGEPKVLWEFSHKDDPDMHYSYGQAQIVRISSTGQWVALIPNGYVKKLPSSHGVTPPGGSGHAVLFVVDLKTGNLIAKLNTGEGSASEPNGLATPIAVDSVYYQGGGLATNPQTAIDIGADYAYAGDLYGNLWRFDFTGSTPADWQSSITKVVKGSKDQPITTQPKIVTVPFEKQTAAKDVVVVFGTGKYLETADRSTSIEDQYLVGVYDGLGNSTNPAASNHDFKSGSFVEQSYSTNGNRRNLSENTVAIENKNGWRIKLPTDGERIANPLTLFGSQIVIAPSTIPGGIDPCIGGGTSWLLAFDPVTGAKPAVNIFAEVVGTTTGPNGNTINLYEYDEGVRVNDLIVGAPSFLENQGGGNVNVVVEGFSNVETVNIQKFTWRRRNWTNLLTE